MKKTLRNIVGSLGFLAMVSGCTGMGAVMSTSNDPRTRFVGNLMYHESAHQDRIKEAEAGRSEVNVYQERKQIEKIHTYKIVNLDIGQEEIEVVGENNYRKYVFKNFNQGKFPKKGYVIVLKINGISHKVWQIKDVEKFEDYFQIVREEKPSPKTLLPYM